MKLGLLGGTFNPIHNAHLRIAEDAREAVGLERVLFIPAATPPHKPLAGELSFAARMEMVRLAIAANPAFAVSDLEGVRGGRSYSVDTLAALREVCPADELHFIIGGDSFLDLGSWHRYEEIFQLCSIVVVQRPGAVFPSLADSLPVAMQDQFCYDGAAQKLVHASGHTIQAISGVPLEISSSGIRELARLGRSIRYLVPDAVEHYIKEQGLYLDD